MKKLLGNVSLGLALSLGLSSAADAQQSWPARPVKLVVGYAAGGPADVPARLVATRMAESLGQPVVIDNRAGAAGNIASESVAKASADGYTILLATVASHGLNGALYSKLPYEPIKDFAPIGLITTSPSVLLVAADSPYKSVRDLVSAARARPGAFNAGTSGSGSTPHLAATWFAKLAGLEVTNVPFKGGMGPALTELMAQRLDFLLTPGAVQHVKGGKLRALAVAAKRRLPALPDVPTFDESGIPGFHTDWWVGLVAPAGTPQPILDKLTRALNHALASAELQKQFVELGALPVESTDAAVFWGFVQRSVVANAELVRAAGARAE